MWSIATKFLRRVAGHTKWHEATKGDRFVWRRWTADGWEYRKMTEAEHNEAIAMWSIK